MYKIFPPGPRRTPPFSMCDSSHWEKPSLKSLKCNERVKQCDPACASIFNSWFWNISRNALFMMIEPGKVTRIKNKRVLLDCCSRVNMWKAKPLPWSGEISAHGHKGLKRHVVWIPISSACIVSVGITCTSRMTLRAIPSGSQLEFLLALARPHELPRVSPPPPAPPSPSPWLQPVALQ